MLAPQSSLEETHPEVTSNYVSGDLATMAQSKAIYLSTLKLKETSPRKEHNEEILETNKSKKSISIISNLYRVDARSKISHRFICFQ